jgi:hypothetical protein
MKVWMNEWSNEVRRNEMRRNEVMKESVGCQVSVFVLMGL